MRPPLEPDRHFRRSEYPFIFLVGWVVFFVAILTLGLWQGIVLFITVFVVHWFAVAIYDAGKEQG